MRKFYFILFIAIFFFSVSKSYGQVANYSFTQSSVVYTPITGGTVLGTTTSDDERFVDPAIPLGGFANTGPGFPIGFTFNYNGINFNRFAINNNGWISLGQSTLTPSVDINSSLSLSTQLSATSVAIPAYLRSRIVGFGRDIQAQAGAELRIETIGVTPNRKCVIQWSGYRRFVSTGEDINFQIVLNETTNVVQVIYGTCVFTGSNSAQSGIGGTTNSDFNCRTTTTDWTATTLGPTNTSTCSFSTTIAPPSGLVFAWAPLVLCTGVPSPGLISGPSGTVCGSIPVNLNLSGYTSDAGITFQWKSSAIPGGPYTNIGGATGTSYSFTSSATRYYIVTVTCTNSGLSSNTSEFAVNVSPLAHTNVSATPTTTCTPGSSAITGTAINGVTTSGIGVVGNSGTINLAIPDNNPIGVNSTIALPATNIPNASSLQVRINATHTWVGDLAFKLTNPCGVTYLFDRPGVNPPATCCGNSQDLGGIYTFDIGAATVIPETNSGPTIVPIGSYKPSDVIGNAHNWAGLTFPCSGAGNWTLNVTDGAGGDLGTLIDWQVLAPIVGVYTHTLTGPGTITQNASTGANNATANFSVSALPAGVHNYTLKSTDMAGCTVSSPLTVTVNPTPVVTIVPAAPVICAGAIQTLTANVVPGNIQTYNSAVLNLAIPDNNPTGVTTAAITLPAGNINAASNLKVRINANHSWVGDLIFRLNSPCGTTFLFDRPGVPATSVGNSSNLGTSNVSTPPPAVYIFDIAAATIIPETLLPSGFIPAGSYIPSDAPGLPHNWAGLTFPCAGAGGWTLTISDNAGGDLGTLVDWSIIIDNPTPVIFSPITNLFTNSIATIAYTGTPVNVIYAKPATTTIYTATATLGSCSASANVTVTVNQLPAITAHPVALAAPICPGFTANYSVTATGTGLTYQWQLSTAGAGGPWNSIANGPQYSGVTTNALSVLSVTTAQNGHQFRCVVSGTCTPPATSNPVALVVSTTPTISTQPANRIVCAGIDATFSVVATGIPVPAIYQWQVSTNAGSTWTNLTTGGSYTPTLSVTGTTTAMNGNLYRVIVTNICGQSVTSTNALLTVNPTPVVTVAPFAGKICLSDAPIALSGSPVGGSWSGIGVSGFNFVPTATAVGTYTLTYTFTNTFGCTSTANLIAKVEECQERVRLLRNNAVILFPNPNKGNFNIRINSVLYNYLGMNVYSSSGQLVNSKNFTGLTYGSVIPINLTHLPSGIYMVKFFYDDGIRTSEKTFPVVIGRN